MLKADLEMLVAQHLQDAEALRVAGRHNGAYYHLGYVVEIALKLCICRYFARVEYPPNDMFRFKDHGFDRLLVLSGLYNAILT